MNNLIRSECRRQRSVRLPAIAVAAAAAAGALTAIAIITTAGHGDTPALHRGGLTELAHAPYAIVAGSALLLGIFAVAGEFRHQTSSATRPSPPPCSPHPAADGSWPPKSSSTPHSAPSLPSSPRRSTSPSPSPGCRPATSPLSGPVDVARVLLGGVAAGALFGAAGAGLGALIVNQTAAVTVSLVWLLAIEGLVVSLASTPGHPPLAPRRRPLHPRPRRHRPALQRPVLGGHRIRRRLRRHPGGRRNPPTRPSRRHLNDTERRQRSIRSRRALRGQPSRRGPADHPWRCRAVAS
jgi:ABC-2 type transport system permease protein